MITELISLPLDVTMTVSMSVFSNLNLLALSKPSLAKTALSIVFPMSEMASVHPFPQARNLTVVHISPSFSISSH